MADLNKNQKLHRKLKTRHMTMIAIGGSIGTGLFLSSGATISQAGPGGALLAYMLVGLMVYFIMTSLGELSAFNPTSGSFATFGALYVDKAFGFAQGWNYWYNWAITLAVELVAAALIMGYWFPDVPGWIWSGVFYFVILGINLFSVKGFGETEFWFALIKVVTVIIFVVIGLLMIFKVMNGETGDFNVLENLTGGEAPFVGGIPAMMGVVMIAAFSFQGTEMIGVAAGESDNPEKSIPRATRQIFWRILLFYVLAIFVIGCLINYNDPNLLKNDETDVSFSPFTLVFKQAGLGFAAAVMNAVILTSVLSAGNSGLFASSRILFEMGRNGLAPKFFGYVTKAGVPLAAVLCTAVVAALCFLTSLFKTSDVYLYLLNASGMCGFVTWIGISICHFRFRRAIKVQNFDRTQLPYLAKYFPIGPILSLIMLLFVILGQDWDLVTGKGFDLGTFISTYLGLALFFVLYFGYKFTRNTKVIPLEEIDLTQRAK
ncbi:gamma-aminobutyrate permease [Psittacicella hinzii]|uniref:Gamma-aminobutyrate permease n=1 Tax=Psittacicella hinzii TaxID=2028575 RepID=A0A3A1Y542_9GAMM|nr:amino acid permease [Psittacicella hinzii]RIY32386.1 gamma-aminobutyrate permease [Psittacicella hinzii]